MNKRLLPPLLYPASMADVLRSSKAKSPKPYLLDANGNPLNPTFTGTWVEMLPTLVAVATQAPQKDARDFALSQLMLLAEIVDKHISNLEALAADSLPADAVRDFICPDCGGRKGVHCYGCPNGPQPKQRT